GIELHAERSHVGAELEYRRGEFRALVTHREFRIRDVAFVAIRIAEMFAHPRDHVELVARRVVAQPVARILGKPVFPRTWIDIATDAVADAERDQLGIAGLGIDAAD